MQNKSPYEKSYPMEENHGEDCGVKIQLHLLHGTWGSEVEDKQAFCDELQGAGEYLDACATFFSSGPRYKRRGVTPRKMHQQLWADSEVLKKTIKRR